MVYITWINRLKLTWAMVKQLSPSVIITDTSCLIILEKISALYLLHELFSEVITTLEIEREYGKPLPTWVKIIAVKNNGLVSRLLNKCRCRRSDSNCIGL